jgi:5-bromo-4-chloroindolyl phosphate hydrolysis protein
MGFSLKMEILGLYWLKTVKISMIVSLLNHLCQILKRVMIFIWINQNWLLSIMKYGHIHRRMQIIVIRQLTEEETLISRFLNLLEYKGIQRQNEHLHNMVHWQLRGMSTHQKVETTNLWFKAYLDVLINKMEELGVQKNGSNNV